MSDIDAQISEHVRAVEALRREAPLLQEMADLIVKTFRSGGHVYVFGNGGSAADAQHIAAELLGRFKRDRRALPAVALTTDSSILTAVGNDLGGNEIFKRQVEGLVTRRDTVWALSVSGVSLNILSALKSSRATEATIIGFTSKSGSRMADLCDLCLRVDAETSDRVQEAHELAYHIICDLVEASFA